MTQTSPRPAAQTATNNSKHTANGSVESGAPATDHPLDSNLISPQQVSNPLDLEGTQQTEYQGVNSQRRGISLRTKVTALAISLGILPVLVFGAINNFLSTQQTKTNAIQVQETLSIILADKISRFVFERYENILILSQLQIFTDSRLFNRTSSQEKEAQLKSFSDAYGVYDSIALFDLNGNMIVKTGGQIGKNSKGQITNNIKDRDHFQTVLKTDRPVISQPSISKTTGKASIFMAAPVKDTVTGKTIAVIRTRMPVEAIDELIKTEENLLTSVNQSRSTSEYHLIGANNKLFLATEEDEVGKNATLEIPNFAQMQLSKKVRSVINVDNNDNLKKLVTYAPVTQLEGVPELNWSIILAEDSTTVFAAQRRLLLSLLLGTGLLVLIVSAIAARLADRTTQPILAAADTVEKLGQGNLDTRVAVKGDDELAVLGSNINLMASQLQDLLREKEAETQQTANLLTQIQASAKRLNKQNSVFVELSTNKALGSGDLNVVFQEITEATSQTLEIERASVWLYNSDRSGIRCTDLYEKSAGHHSAGTELLAVAYPAYFKALVEERIIVANNAHTAPQTKEFSASHLSPLGITSMLNAQIRLGNQVVGVICCEHVGPSRQWALEEQNFVASMADTVALSMEAYERKQVEEELKISEERQRQEKQALQRRAMELLVEVDPVSKGDLTIRANVTEDEIGTIADSYNATIGNLRKIVTQVQAAATQVVRTTNSNEVSVSEVSEEALRQAQEIAVALSRIQEMSNSIRAVATSAAQAEAAVEEATQTVEAGDAAMNRTVRGILAIRETVTETSQKVKRLGESSQNISKVVNLIGTFAAQTNLLALKASIEAARAGEEGRGFAVLADEVRGLARQSAQATAEIESLVIAIQTETNEVASAMETGSVQVAEGTKLVDETRQSLNKITAVSAQIGALVEAIAAAAVVQSQASEEVTQTISDVAASANKNSNSATLVSASFKELLAVANELQASASQFKVS